VSNTNKYDMMYYDRCVPRLCGCMCTLVPTRFTPTMHVKRMSLYIWNYCVSLSRQYVYLFQT